MQTTVLDPTWNTWRKSDRLFGKTYASGKRSRNKGKKIMLNGVANAIMLYASPVWFDVYSLRKYRDEQLTVQVVASEPPFDLLAQERHSLFQRSKQQEKRWVIRRWQQRWKAETKGSWTKRLIPNVKICCLFMHKKLNFYFTQFLIGHGVFWS